MSPDLREKLAPFIRGLTFDGHTGAIVTPADSTSDPDGPDQFVVDGLSLKELQTGATATVPISSEFAGRILDAYARFQGKEGRRPSGCVFRFDDGTEVAFRIRGSADSARVRTDQTQSRTDELLFLHRSSVVAGKIALVTGGAQGFGEGIVRSLAAGGCIVCIVDLNLAGARSLAEELNGEYDRPVAYAFGANVTDEDSVRSMVSEVVGAVGGVDIVVSNAGVLKAGSVTEISVKDFNFVTSVNYVGFFICTKLLAPVMALQNAGSGGRYFSDIIQINSKSGLAGSNRNGAYAGSKFGAIGLVQSFALELVTQNIKVNAICPGNFFEGPLWADPDRGLFVQYLRAGKVPGATSIADVKRFYEEKVPMARGCRPKDVVRAICYLVEQEYETGQAVPVTGGQVMLN
ncbi:MAG TPA: SDR family NAD(P)-dependent oxidoreductase [Spirochaetia bacterium]|nr:SDR family NAD(P)-dependent oxidoreductase [Spirochaetia bacterium]